MLVTCYLVMSYVASIVDDAVPRSLLGRYVVQVRALEGDAQQQMLGRLLSEQMAKLCSVPGHSRERYTHIHIYIYQLCHIIIYFSRNYIISYYIVLYYLIFTHRGRWCAAPCSTCISQMRTSSSMQSSWNASWTSPGPGSTHIHIYTPIYIDIYDI